ncbi:MAG: trypsin-like peptidase domain-containing protein, partial [Actinomycetota bacterium]|nr:trypsin-like peptidase domain-containing protein [Actinomycetota bacterium]
GKPLDARPIYYDENEDISVLRVPGASGEPALRTNPRPKLRSSVAVLGFPFGRRYKARAARLGPTFPLPPDAPPKRRGRPATMLRSGLGVGPGASGGPVVDRGGRVVAMIFAATPLEQRRNQLGIPGPAMRTALRSALSSPRTVGTGSCHSHS